MKLEKLLSEVPLLVHIAATREGLCTLCLSASRFLVCLFLRSSALTAHCCLKLRPPFSV